MAYNQIKKEGKKILDTLRVATQYIEKHLDKELLSENVCNQVNYSLRQLDRIFISAFGVTVSKYIRKRRLTLAIQEIKAKKNSISYIANKYQYDTSVFSKAIRSEFGIRPKECISNIDGLELFEDEFVSSDMIAEITQALDSMKENGLLSYKFDKHKQKIKIKNIDFKWFYSYLNNIPLIPLPESLISALHNCGCSESITAAITYARYEYESVNYDIRKMRWDLSQWEMIVVEENPTIESLFSEVELFYDLDNPRKIFDTGILWYCPKHEILSKLLKVIGRESMNKRPLSFCIDKVEFMDFAEAATECGFVKFRGNTDHTDIEAEFNAKQFLQFVSQMGSEVSLHENRVKELKLLDSTKFLVALNNEIEASLNNGNSFYKSIEELKIRWYIVGNYYNLDNPLIENGYYKYRFDPFIHEILNSLVEIEDAGLERFPLIYQVNQKNDELQLTLADPFCTIYLQDNNG